ncbi:MAG: cysteine synthase A [Clostridia bacterium]
MKIYNNVTELIGKTPIIKLCKFTDNLNANIFAKLEYFNPAGSIKDRAALSMINAGIRDKKINKDTVLIEPTSGNTGIGLASIASSMGLKTILTMPETMSIERRKLLKAYGASIVLTSGKLGMKGAVDKAVELTATTPNAFMPSQFSNDENSNAHYNTTGPEIFEDMDGKIDIFISAVGTGGTITGVGKYLKEKIPTVKIIAVEPFSSPVLSGGTAGPHKLQGIGAGFIPDILDTKIYDEIIQITDDEGIETMQKLATSEGILVGISSGAALMAATKVANRAENKGKNIVVILPDTGERYLSMMSE